MRHFSFSIDNNLVPSPALITYSKSLVYRYVDHHCNESRDRKSIISTNLLSHRTAARFDRNRETSPILRRYACERAYLHNTWSIVSSTWERATVPSGCSDLTQQHPPSPIRGHPSASIPRSFFRSLRTKPLARQHIVLSARETLRKICLARERIAHPPRWTHIKSG